MTLPSFKVSLKLNTSGLSNLNLTPLWAGMITGFLMAALSYLGVPASRLLNPFPWNKNAMIEIQPRLEQKTNSYRLSKPASIIPAVQADNADEIGKAYAVVDFDTGEIIMEKNLSQPMPIASLTKIMTAVTALDLAAPDDVFGISANAAAKIPTKIGVVPGQKMSLEEFLNATLLTSANDAAEVIREGIDRKYGKDVFVKAMNLKAEIIGLHNTRFHNPQGFDDKDNYSTVEDLAVLTHYALDKYPLIADIVAKDYAFLDNTINHKQFDLYNWNGLLGVYPGVFGVKIGNTAGAGTTTVVASQRENKRLLVVLLGASDVLDRDLKTATLLDRAFESSIGLNPVDVTVDQLQRKYASWKYN